MSLRAVLIIALGIASGTFAVFGGRMWGVTPIEDAVAVPETVAVVIAKEPMELGFTIKEESVETREWPKDLVHPAALLSTDKAIGRVTLSTILAGELILDGKLAPEGVRRGAGGLVRVGMRAYTIMATSAASSVAGLILPGDLVDLILAIEGSRNNAAGNSTFTLLQNIEILAVNQRMESAGDLVPKLQSVTLLVTQQQAEVLALAQRAGNLTLSLRNPEDKVIVDNEPISLATIQQLRRFATSGQVPTDGTSDEPQSDMAAEDAGGEGSSGSWVAQTGDSSAGPSGGSRKFSRSTIRTIRGSLSGDVPITISNN